jgi:hypothetical protein
MLISCQVCKNLIVSALNFGLIVSCSISSVLLFMAIRDNLLTENNITLLFLLDLVCSQRMSATVWNSVTNLPCVHSCSEILSMCGTSLKHLLS